MKTSVTRVPTLFESYRQALDSQDVMRAIGTAVQIGDVNADIKPLLIDYISALGSENAELAQVLLVQIADSYQHDIDEQELLQRAVTTAGRANIPYEKRKTLLDFAQEASAVQLRRSSFLLDSLSHFQIKRTKTDQNLKSAAQNMRAAEDKLDTQKETVKPVTTEASVSSAPALLGVTGPDELTEGSLLTAVLTIENVGDAKTKSLSLEVTSGAGLSATAPGNVTALQPAERQTIEIQISGQSAGTHELNMTLNEDGAVADTLAETFTVESDAVSVRKAITGSEDGVPNMMNIQQSISYWSDSQDVPGTGGKTVSTEQVQKFITEWLATRERDK